MEWTVAIGVDRHRDTHVAVAVDRLGGRLDSHEIETTGEGYCSLVSWALELGSPVFALEGAGSYGAGLVRFLECAGFAVYECERPRRQERRRGTRTRSSLQTTPSRRPKPQATRGRSPRRLTASHVRSSTRTSIARRALFEQSLALRRKLGDKRNIANSLCYLGSVALLEGDYDAATGLLDESLALGRDLGNLLIVSVGLANQSLVTLAAGDAPRAAALCIESLALSHELGDRRTSVECLHALAGIAAVQAEPLRAALLSGAAESLHAEIKAPPSPAERMVGDRFLPIARAAVDDQSFEAAWVEGRQMAYDAAVTYALENSQALQPHG
jgi:Transposase